MHEELVDGYDVAGVGELVEVGGIDETGGRHVVGLDGPGGDGVVVPADAVPIPGGEDVGGAALLRAGKVAVAVQLVAVLPAAVVVGVAEAVAVVLVVAVAVGVAGGVVGGVVGVAAALVLVDVTGGGGGVGGGAVVALGTVVGAAVVLGAAVLGSMAGGGAGCRADGGGATVTGGGVTGPGTGRGTICGTQVTEPEPGGFAGTDRAGVPDELRGVSDTHGTPEDALEDPPEDPEAETCWPWISEVKSATPGAPAAGPVQYRYSRSSTSVLVNGTIWIGVPTQDASRMYGRPPTVPR